MTGGDRPTFQAATVKPFCPCDAGRPEDCKPEKWPGAHSPASCLGCGMPNYQHIYSSSDEIDGAGLIMYCRPSAIALAECD